MAKLKITQSSSITNVTYPQPIVDRNTGPESINGAYVGGTGGDTGQAGRQIQGQVYIKGASSAQGFIIAQKGSHKFRVQDASTNKGTCTLTNSPNPTAGQMNILLTLNTGAANIAAANVAGGATSTTITYDTRTTVTGPAQLPRVGDYISFTGGAPSASIGTFVQVTAFHYCILFSSYGTKCRYLCFEPHICQVVFQETSMEYVYYTGILNVTAQRKQSELFLQLIGRISFQ